MEQIVWSDLLIIIVTFMRWVGFSGLYLLGIKKRGWWMRNHTSIIIPN